MEDNDQNQRPWSGPFGVGWQGYLIVAFIIAALTGQQPTHIGPHFP